MIKTNPLSVEAIEIIASLIRELYKVKETEYFPIMSVLDSLFEDGNISYQIIEDEDPRLPANTPAIYDPNENFIYIKESVIEEYETGNYRSSFTLCHEFFHYIQAQLFNFEFKEVDECKAYEEVDWQANEFAGQLLIPSKYIGLEEHALCKMYHVSIECALTRKAYLKKRKRRKENE